MASLGVFAIVFDERDRLLCVRMNYGARNWTTPGGRVESGESPIEALKREVREETGFEIEPTDLVGVYAKPFEDDIVLCFEAQIIDRSAWSPNEEISAVQFFDSSTLPDDMTFVVRTRVIDGIERRRNMMRVFKNPTTLAR